MFKSADTRTVDRSVLKRDVIKSHLVFNSSLYVRVAALVERHPGEEILDEGEEERLILIHQLGEVHVPEYAHDDGGLTVLGVGALGGAQGTQHGQNVTQPKVIVDLSTCTHNTKTSGIMDDWGIIILASSMCIFPYIYSVEIIL